MFDKMKNLMEMKKQADKIKKDLEAIVVEVKEFNGIKIVINGAQSFRSIEIDASRLSPEGKNRFEYDLLRSLNTAIKKSQTAAAQKMSSVMPGF